MRAVVMAGGEGTRLRPMTASQPKPMLPVANRPIMEHVLRLLRRHGFDDTVVTVQFLAALVRTYFGDGEAWGMHLHYATEQTPLGTAGSVRNAAGMLRHEPFLVISGDALTDIDLTALVAFHRRRGALVTVALARVAQPLEFGIVITGADGRIERFLEKPSWGQVFSDTVNTGIYVMEPEVLDRLEDGVPADWSGDVFPALLAEGAPLFGYVADGYWEDVGTIESYLRVQDDVLRRRVDVDIGGFELSPGVWVAEGADIDAAARLSAPLLIGPNTKVEAGAELAGATVLGSNVVVKRGASLDHALVHDNVFIGTQARLRGCVVGKNTDVMRAARVGQGAVIGDECVIEEEAVLANDVRVYPFKTVEAGAVVNTSVIWESRGARALFGPRGVSGLVNVDMTPEHVVRLAGAFAATLDKGSVVTTARDASRAARSLQWAVASALTASSITVEDLGVVPAPVARFTVGSGAARAGVVMRTTPGDPQGVDIAFLDHAGTDLSPAAQRRLERVFSRQEFRRAFPGEIADITFPARAVDAYVRELLERVDTRGVAEARLKVVLDAGGGTAAVVLPALLGRLEVDVLTVNNRLDEAATAGGDEAHLAGLARLGDLVAGSGASFGVRFDPVGERVALVDDTGRAVHDDRALLVVMDLVAAERRGGRAALPVTTTRVAEQVARFHGVEIAWTAQGPGELTRAAGLPDVIFAGDGRGGLVIPEFSRVPDGLAAFVRLLGLVARTRLPLSRIDARIPPAFVLRRSVPTPWAAKGAVMRRVRDVAGGATVDTTDGVRVVGPDGWALVLPDPAEAATHLWAEGPDEAGAQALLDRWTSVVSSRG